MKDWEGEMEGEGEGGGGGKREEGEGERGRRGRGERGRRGGELGKGRKRVGMEWTDVGSFPQFSNNGGRHIYVHM